ncbi:MAG TPA: hypothetical protein DEV81_01605 [Cyanobacteria bacterium UBA11049]|nr:hypothetical protein [Cyanobacteria bacterium UBA11049]
MSINPKPLKAIVAVLTARMLLMTRTIRAFAVNALATLPLRDRACYRTQFAITTKSATCRGCNQKT